MPSLHVKNPKTLGEWLTASTNGAMVTFGDGEGDGKCVTALSGCGLTLYVNDAIKGNYALDQLLRSLPLETLEKFRVDERSPAPPTTRRKR
jgi:hypothetical protein